MRFTKGITLKAESTVKSSVCAKVNAGKFCGAKAESYKNRLFFLYLKSRRTDCRLKVDAAALRKNMAKERKVKDLLVELV